VLFTLATQDVWWFPSLLESCMLLLQSIVCRLEHSHWRTLIGRPEMLSSRAPKLNGRPELDLFSYPQAPLNYLVSLIDAFSLVCSCRPLSLSLSLSPFRLGQKGAKSGQIKPLNLGPKSSISCKGAGKTIASSSVAMVVTFLRQTRATSG